MPNDTGAVAETPPADDLRSQLAAAMEGTTSTETPADTGAAPVTDPAAAAPAATDPRPRDALGRFTRPDGTPDPDQTPRAGEVAAAPGAAPAQQQPAAAPEAPHHWAAADKQWLGSVPPEHRAGVLDRFKRIESGFQRPMQERAYLLQEYGPVEEIFAPHREQLKAAGVTPAQMIRSWAEVEKAMMADPVQTLVAIAQGYKIDPQRIVAALSGHAPAQAEDPVQAAIQAALKPYITELQTVKGSLSKRDEEIAAARQGHHMQQIDRFIAETDAQGNPKHPHFETVYPQIIAQARFLAEHGQPIVLQDLYDQAVWANPATRAQLMSSQQSADAQERERQQREKATAAQRAGASLSGAPGVGSVPKGSVGSVRDDLMAAMSAGRV